MEDYVIALIFLGFVIFSICIITPLAVYDLVYVKPIVSERANQYCKDEGFDFYEEYERRGFFSKEPIAIRCKYVEQYRNVDLNIKKEVGNNGTE